MLDSETKPLCMQVMDRAQWDEEQEVWMLQQLPKKVTKRPISTAQHRRPVTAYAQAAVALGDHNPRYKTDNILALALDMPDRTTADYSGSQMQTQVCTDINAACRYVKIWIVQNACTLSPAAWCGLVSEICNACTFLVQRCHKWLLHAVGGGGNF